MKTFITSIKIHKITENNELYKLATQVLSKSKSDKPTTKNNEHPTTKEEGTQKISFICHECEFKSDEVDKRNDHRKEIHPSSKLLSHVKRVHLKQRNFQCTECDYKAGHKVRLHAHVKSVHLKLKDFLCKEKDCTDTTRPKIIPVKNVIIKEPKELIWMLMSKPFIQR